MASKIDLKTAPVGTGGSQMQNFAFKPATIELVEVIDGKTGFGLDNKRLPVGQTRDVKKLRVSTNVVGDLLGSKGDNAGKKFPVRASEVFNLTQRGNEWLIPGNDKSNIQVFLKKMGVKEVNDLIGKQVMTVLRKSKDGSKDFLGIAQ